MTEDYIQSLNGGTSPDITFVATTVRQVKEELHRFIIGNDDLIQALLICLLAEGNVLITGNPGIAKTTAAKLFARTLGCDFNRQQFTPDVLPTDITGSYVYDQKTGEFHVRKGGIFANIVMVDEINRASPRTQSALLESMEEKSVTIEGTTFPLDRPFMVIATETMVESDGTYALPKVQLDRFTLQVTLDYPDPDDALAILRLKNLGEQSGVVQVTDKEAIVDMIDTVKAVYVDDAVLRYIRDIVTGTQHHTDVALPASPRASIHLLQASKALAAMRGRNYLVPDDVQETVHMVLTHRLLVSEKAVMEGITVTTVIDDIVAATDVD